MCSDVGGRVEEDAGLEVYCRGGGGLNEVRYSLGFGFMSPRVEVNFGLEDARLMGLDTGRLVRGSRVGRAYESLGPGVDFEGDWG